MRAVVFDHFGGPEVLCLADLPDPKPGPDQVLIAVAASTVNPTDLLMRSGAQARMMTDLPPPWIAGMEFSGRVVAGGELAPGTPVFGVVNPRRLAGGAYAERIVAPRASVAAVPQGIDLVAAATVPMNALTALLALDLAGLVAGQSLLVTGGAGMLGGSVIPLAKACGLVVVANVAAEDAALVRGLGATHVVPRDQGRDAVVRALFPQGVDALIDGALIGNVVAPLVRDGGVAVGLRGSHPITDSRLKSLVVSVLSGMENAGLLARIAQGLADGTLHPRVAPGGVFQARDAVAAHRMAETGRLRGRVVLTFA